MSLLVFCNVALVGVGFCSFVGATSFSASIDFDIEVGDVQNSNVFNISKVDLFTLGPDGIVSDETIVSSATIVAEFYIDNALASTFLNNGVLNFKTRLESTDLTFLQKYVSLVPACSGVALLSNEILDADKAVVSSLSYTPEASIGMTKAGITYTVQDDGTIKDYFSNRPTFNFKVEVA
ncbi:MAG: hypothetical protein ACI32C_02675 [Candidatus Enteromonas sp.]